MALTVPKAVLHWLAQRLSPRPFRLTMWDQESRVIGRGAPDFHIAIRRPLPWRVLLAPDPAFGDAYVEGAVDIDPLPRFFDAYLSGPVRAPTFISRLLTRLADGTPVSKQYEDVQSHYDRGNAFFSLWLDSTRSYSEAHFRHPKDTLDTAQEAKIDHVLRRACLEPGHRLLEIGSGWGALLIEAARRYGVRAHGLTLSRQQLAHTQELIQQHGLEGRVSVELKDYREMAAEKSHRFDRIISIGMLEHVGRPQMGEFFHAVRRLLTDKGLCVLRTMTRVHECLTSPWIRKHVFPGCYVPGWNELVRHLSNQSFHLVGMESFRRHYGQTLMHWAARMEQKLGAVRTLGFDETFIRMWRFYLHACAGSFRNGALDLHELVFTPEVHNGLPMTSEELFQDRLPRRTAEPTPAAN